MALTEKLTNIANAIREKGGTSDLLTLDAMPSAIAAITTGESGDTMPEEIEMLGNLDYAFAYNVWNWFLEKYSNRIKTKDITTAKFCFHNNLLEVIDIPFNGSETQGIDAEAMFKNCSQLKQLKKPITNLANTKDMFNGCTDLRYLPEMTMITYKTPNCGYGTFQGCRSLREVPEEFLKKITSSATSTYNCHIYNMFSACHALNEIVGLNPYSRNMTSNLYSWTGDGLCRIKNFIFATQDDGTVYTLNQCSQTIDLSKNVGYALTQSYVNGYYAGITGETQIKDEASYELYKNHVDSWTLMPEYSRYNKTSAVLTINSLPDTSAFVASQNKPNTIKFNGNCGSLTDGGAINTLTEEEIAVATAKGWTVSFI